MAAVGPLSKTLEYAGDMLAATGAWQDLAGEDARDHIYIAALPRAWGQDIHTADDLRAAAPYAIVHFDDQGISGSFIYTATSNQFVGQHNLIFRLYFVPPEEIDGDDTNVVEEYILNQVGLIIRGSDPSTSPGLLDLSGEAGHLIIRQIDYSSPLYTSDEQRAEDHALIVTVELVLAVGVSI